MPTATAKSIHSGPKRKSSLRIGPKKNASSDSSLASEQTTSKKIEIANVHTPLTVQTLTKVKNAARRFKKRRRSSSGPKEKRTVYLKYHVFNVLEIDTLNSTFTARFSIEGTWEEPQLNGFDKNEVTLEMLDDIWKPRKIKFANEVEGFYTNSSGSIDGDEVAGPQIELCDWEVDLSLKNKNAVVTCYFHYFATFATEMSLQMFPFDYQTLVINIEMHSRDADITFVDNPFRLSKVDSENVQLSEWYVLGHVGRNVKTEKMNIFQISIGTRRRAGYYVTNVFAPIFVITSLTWLPYTISAERSVRGMRIQVTLLLFLTSIAFKFYVAEYLPKIAYSTLCDGYILSALVCQASIAVEIGFVGAVIGDADVAALVSFEGKFAVILASLWGVLLHIALLVTIYKYKWKVRVYTKSELSRKYSHRVHPE